jgi:hypothetical protein
MGFTEVVNDQAYLKAGLLGLQGAGKTMTGAKILIGLHKHLVARKVIDPALPVHFMDSETGSTWLRPLFADAGITLMVDKTRAFPALVRGCKEVSKLKGLLLIDSITHFWRELCEAYAKEKNRRKLEFSDWNVIKSRWNEFTDLYVNGAFHCVMCGRQGYEYDMYEDDNGKKKIEKAGVKMKAETETGYEPNLLVLMERHQELDGSSIKRQWRTAYILKDRCQDIDGKSFDNPDFADFLPHINRLNLGGDHVGVDTSETSQGTFPRDDNSWKYERDQCTIMLEEIKGLMVRYYPSQSADDKRAKADLVREFFNTESWTKVELMSLLELRTAYVKLHTKLVGAPPEGTPQPPALADQPF